jgi:hypothetical protein
VTSTVCKVNGRDQSDKGPIAGGDPRRRTVSPTIIRVDATNAIHPIGTQETNNREVNRHGTPSGHWA